MKKIALVAVMIMSYFCQPAAAQGWQSIGNNNPTVGIRALWKLTADSGLYSKGYDVLTALDLPYLNVLDFGAKGDGVTDDYLAIQAALDSADRSDRKRVYFPFGIYMTSKTIYLYSNLEVFGFGKDKSTIKATSDAVLDLVIPQTGIPTTLDRVKYKPLLATITANDTSPNDTVYNIRIQDIGLDYNDVACGTYSATALLIGRAVNCEVYNVKFHDCLPQNLNNTSIVRRGNAVIFAFSEDCSLHHCEIGSADYESISVWFLSRRIYIYKNTFILDKPTTFAYQNHAIQVAVPASIGTTLMDVYGRETSGDVFIYHNTFLLKRGVESAITLHTSEDVTIYKNYFKSYETNEPYWGIKPFDSSKNILIELNFFDYTKKIDSDLGFTVIGTNASSLTTTRIDSNIIIRNNFIRVSNPSKHEVVLDRPVIGSTSFKAHNTEITDNHIEIYNYKNRATKAIATYGDNVSISDNKIYYKSPAETIDANGHVAIYAKNGKNINITENISYGDSITSGVVLNSTETVVMVANNMTNVIGTPSFTANVIKNNTLQEVTALGSETTDSVTIDGITIDGKMPNSMTIGNFPSDSLGDSSIIIGYHNLPRKLASYGHIFIGQNVGDNHLGAQPINMNVIGIGRNAITRGYGLFNSGVFIGVNVAMGAANLQSAVSIGVNARAFSINGAESVSIGRMAGYGDSSTNTNGGISIGRLAHYLNKGNNSLALGDSAGSYNIYNNVVQIGTRARAWQNEQVVFSTGAKGFGFSTAGLTLRRSFIIPDKDGTMALTSDVPNTYSATASGNGTTTITITLPASSTWVNVIPTNSVAGDALIKYIGVSGTTLTINTVNATASGTNNLSYNIEYK